MAQVDRGTYERLRASTWGVRESAGTGGRIAASLRLAEVPRAALVAIAVLAVVAVALGAVLWGRLGVPAVIERDRAAGGEPGGAEGGRGALPPAEDAGEAVAGASVPGDDAAGTSGVDSGPAEFGAAAGDGGVPEGAARPAATLRVHVAGAVAAPGVYELPEGARVLDAVEAAGGLAPDADMGPVNLAEPLGDGCKVTVPALGETAGAPAVEPAGVGGAGGGSGAAPTTVNINTADEAALQELPGVGEATAAAIVRDREQNGPFASPEDLMRVSGIGEKKLERMRPMVVV